MYRPSPRFFVRTLVPGLLGLYLAAGSAMAQSTLNSKLPPKRKVEGVQARVDTEEKTRTLVLVKREGNDLFYAPPNMAEGVLASLPVAEIRDIEFNIEIDDEAVQNALRARDYITAARLLLGQVKQTLPFISIVNNNATEHALDAGRYLVRAARAKQDDRTEASDANAAALFKGAREVLLYVADAEWFPENRLAQYLAIQCLIDQDMLDQAEDELELIDDPGFEDSATGLYWLTWANLHLSQQEIRRALNAAVRSSVFESKNITTFPDALLIQAHCHEEQLDFHRARDLYFEIARLFVDTEWGDRAHRQLKYIMDAGLTAEGEEANIAKLFFDVEEDMNQVAKDFLEKMKKRDEARQGGENPDGAGKEAGS